VRFRITIEVVAVKSDRDVVVNVLGNTLVVNRGEWLVAGAGFGPCVIADDIFNNYSDSADAIFPISSSIRSIDGCSESLGGGLDSDEQFLAAIIKSGSDV
jgi:hypothetical protein